MASIRASSATAATELKLINSVELKLALASDQGFERLLVVYLCPLILKLASASPQSVEKTRSVLSMIDVRVRGGIYKLPTKTLLVQYHSAVLQQVVRSTALQYLDCALEMSVVENPIALFELFRGFSAATTTQQSTIFNMVCRIFGSMHKGDISARGNINCPQTPSLLLDDETALAARFLDLMFLNLAYFKLQPTGALGESIVPSGDDVRLRLQSAKACLTLDQIEFLNPKGAQTFTVSSLNESRHGLLRFLAQPNSAALFHSSARYLIALVGSFDLDDDTKKLASVLIRHCPARDDYQFALSLYHLILERENPPHQLRSRVFQLLGGNTVATTMVGSAYRALEIGLDCGAINNSNLVILTDWISSEQAR